MQFSRAYFFWRALLVFFLVDRACCELNFPHTFDAWHYADWGLERSYMISVVEGRESEMDFFAEGLVCSALSRPLCCFLIDGCLDVRVDCFVFCVCRDA